MIADWLGAAVCLLFSCTFCTVWVVVAGLRLFTWCLFILLRLFLVCRVG